MKLTIWCDNRSAVITSRKGANTEEIPKRTRHVALRHCKVLNHSQRIWFCPTDLQLADGLTKSCNAVALRHLFTNNPKKPAQEDEEEDDADLDFVDTYIAWFKRLEE